MPSDMKSNKRVVKLFSDLEQIANQPLKTGAELFTEPVTKLFANIEQPASQPLIDNTIMRHELEALSARILELEAQLKEGEKRITVQIEDAKARPTPSILYEKEQVGYAFSDENLKPIQMTNLTASKLDNAINAPFIARGQTIGEMQIGPPSERAWTTEETNLANAVAQQVSLQIQNLRLLGAAERARAEAQAANRQFTHKNWESFLDGIYQSEDIGYAYDQASVTLYTEPSPDEHDFQETVNVLDEHVGNLFLKTDPAHPLTIEDKALVSAVARQLGQQVENLRLLADASRARADAEESTRRLTRQNWENYTQKDDGAVIGFMYDSSKVSPLGNESIPHDIAFEQELVVRGESIGQLAIVGLQNVSQEARDLTAAIAAQASIHLETLRLTEELQKRAKELQELDRLKSAFLANMSHELRTPLNSILGFADVMLEELDGPLTENMSNDLGLIYKNGQHLLHLINDVLDMAKIESGKMNLSPEKFRVHEIIQEVTSITSTLASEKNLPFFIENDSDQEVEIVADRTRIRQVMINVINNAIKFTEKGRISMRVTHQDEHVLISVHDTGIGISTDKLEAVFLEFTQVDTSSTRKAGGTGLGLPISRRLVVMHGGKLWAESTGIDGEGSTFYIKLPLEAKISETDKQESIQK